MLYSLLYGDKPKPETKNRKVYKMAIQRERVRNDVPLRIPIQQLNLPGPLDVSHGDDLILCEATKMVEDMVANVTLHPKEVKTYQRKTKQNSSPFGCDSKIFQNIIQLSNIYSQNMNSTFENQETSALSINCPEVDPDARKLEYEFSFPDEPEEDIFCFYDSLEIKEEPLSQEIDVAPSESIITAPEVNLEEYVALDTNMTNWYDIYSRINDELVREEQNNDGFLNEEAVTKKFYIKMGDKLRLMSINVTEIPNVIEKQSEQISEHQHNLFDEVSVTAASSKRKCESEREEQSTSKKHQHDCQIKLKEEDSSTNEYSVDGIFQDLLLDEDDTFVNAIKLETPVSSPKTGSNDESRVEQHVEQSAQVPSIICANNNFEPSINQSFDGFQTGRGKPIDLPKNNIFKKYLKLYENMNITDDELLSA